MSLVPRKKLLNSVSDKISHQSGGYIQKFEWSIDCFVLERNMTNVRFLSWKKCHVRKVTGTFLKESGSSIKVEARPGAILRRRTKDIHLQWC